MARPFDISKFRRELTKSIEGISAGFHDPKTWLSTGNFTLNYLISGDFFKGIPLGKVAMLAGESGSGKSLVAAGIVREAQAQDVFVVLIDTENALDEAWLQPLGVNTDENVLLKLNMAMIDDLAKTVSTFMKDYKAMAIVDRPKVLFVVDSLGMLLTPTDVAQFEKGDMKGDMGRKAKALYALVRNCVNMFGEHEVGMLCTNHTYASQDQFNPDDKVSGGQGPIFASSILVAMKKMKLKEDEDGVKTSEVQGIRAGCKIMKTRFSKPFESMEIKIPYATGIDPYSGLFDFLLDHGKLTKTGNKYTYAMQSIKSTADVADGANSVEITAYRKQYEHNEDGILDLIMQDITNSGMSVYRNPVIEEISDEQIAEQMASLNNAETVAEVA